MDDKRVIRVVKRVMPAVVSIAISKHLEDIEKESHKELYPFIPGGTHGGKVKVPDEMVDGQGMVQIGGGSGTIVDPSGLILTNKHVVSDRDAEYTVILADGQRFLAEILSRDPINDVAILKIPAKLPAEDGHSPRKETTFPFLKLGDASRLELGQSVIAIGNALGIFRNTVSLGIVSGLSRSVTAQAEPDAAPQEMRGLIQTDAAINPGNSGGPLVDRDCLVVGVNAAIVSGAQSIGFAIPVNAAKRDLADIKKFGRIRRPLLGLRYMMIDGELAAKFGLPVGYGALAVRESEEDAAVVPGSPAEKAGIREKDIVLTFNGEKLDRDHPIQDFLEDLNVGDEARLSVLRDGKELEMRIVLAERK